MLTLKQDFDNDFLCLLERVLVKKTPTCFVRFNEGEYALLVGKRFVGAGGGWQTYEKSQLQKDLKKTLRLNNPDYIYGIASQQHLEANRWYKENIKGTKTFATIFVNSNYQYFRDVLKDIKEPVILVGNEKGKDKYFPFKLKKYYSIPFDVVKFYEEEQEEINKLIRNLTRYKNKLIFFCAGPLSNILIYKCYKINKTNRYIDIGSTLDLYIHGEPTRNYFRAYSKTANQRDIF